GESLPGDTFESVALDWPEFVSGGLRRLGAPDAADLMALTANYTPLPFPDPIDFPGIGCWTPDEVKAIRAWFDTADLSGEKMAAVRRSIEQIGTWVNACTAPDEMLIGFLS